MQAARHRKEIHLKMVEMEQYLGRNIMWVPANKKTRPLFESVRSGQIKGLSPAS